MIALPSVALTNVPRVEPAMFRLAVARTWQSRQSVSFMQTKLRKLLRRGYGITIANCGSC